MSLASVRRALYRLASILGDINALRRGPVAIGKRLVRKAATKAAGRAINRSIK